MPPPPPSAQQPTRPFDTWNSSSTGHQRAETRGPKGWRESRNAKLLSQFRGGHSGGRRMADTVGAFDERLGMVVPAEVRAGAANSVADMLRNPGSMRAKEEGGGDGGGQERLRGDADFEVGRRGDTEEGGRGMFEGLVFYVNGSTHPLISDHKLKRLLADHGARMSTHLGRRRVTHVILGRPNGGGIGAGGGLAGGKLEKEIRRVGGCGVKYVGVEWVLESVEAGKRLPEARFANLKVAARGQQSVLGAFSKTEGGLARGSTQLDAASASASASAPPAAAPAASTTPGSRP
ncbi:hypothetical protein B0T25DRAFT_601695 [Lasiosphaeria hispida]|uniref:BRCT domain-containing protein n=1 Tax=Lasiosphaeria hispida TaxID=260671 RepID=A0AAJ0MIK0_9PEZI|nr:hypothetical protein B0T25DRAFT_601695 [Lasiosphaeria hispida]